jgi:hypothetical protein
VGFERVDNVDCQPLRKETKRIRRAIIKQYLGENLTL